MVEAMAGDCGVYVIEIEGLDNSLYVGQSFHPAEIRLQQHLDGVRASRWVRDYGGKLRPDLYEHLPRLDREGAETLEVLVAEILRREGWTVYGGH